MALEKSVMTKMGIPAGYWMIPYVQIDKFAQQAFVMLYGFYSKEQSDLAKLGQATFMDRKSYNIYPNEFEQYFGVETLNEVNSNQFHAGYEWIKAHDELFKEAVDV